MISNLQLFLVIKVIYLFFSSRCVLYVIFRVTFHGGNWDIRAFSLFPAIHHHWQTFLSKSEDNLADLLIRDSKSRLNKDKKTPQSWHNEASLPEMFCKYIKFCHKSECNREESLKWILLLRMLHLREVLKRSASKNCYKASKTRVCFSLIRFSHFKINHSLRCCSFAQLIATGKKIMPSSTELHSRGTTRRAY